MGARTPNPEQISDAWYEPANDYNDRFAKDHRTRRQIKNRDYNDSAVNVMPRTTLLEKGTKLGETLLAKGWVPDAAVRWRIRQLLAQRLQQQANCNMADFVRAISSGPIAQQVEAANQQHYEVPAEFFGYVLGPRRKYSSAWFDTATTTLAAAEERMLQLSCERARLQDGQRILELGCGWGSASLWMAQKYPASQIVAVSNSASQRAHIEAAAQQQQLHNLRVITCDINQFAIDGAFDGKFDRIFSVEMFEHMHNIPLLFSRASTWLADNGHMFLHVFTHQCYGYFFAADEPAHRLALGRALAGPSDWMARYFFTGGMMPSRDLYANFTADLTIVEQHEVDGIHYARTAQAWLANMDQHRRAILPIFEALYGAADRDLWWHRWRVFFMSCAEMWGYAGGQQWGVSHYLFAKARR